MTLFLLGLNLLLSSGFGDFRQKTTVFWGMRMGLHNSNSWAWSTPSELLGVESSTLLERNYQDREFQQLRCQEAFPQLKHPQVMHNPTGFHLRRVCLNFISLSLFSSLAFSQLLLHDYFYTVSFFFF